MLFRILHFAGIAAAILLIASCFMPWAYYADLHQTFTGFYSHQNYYGKPGKFLTLLSVISLSMMLIPKIWAKRTNLFVAALLVGYAIKNFISFTSCYNAYCPEKQPGIFLMIGSAVIILLAAIFPDLKLKTNNI